MQHPPDPAAPATPRGAGGAAPAGRRSNVWLWVLLVLVAAGALAFRTHRLDSRPFHVDEAVQAVKTGELLDTGRYRYDPFEFHGPSLYYLTLPVLRLRGARPFAASRDTDFRLVPALFGAALVLLVLPLARDLGPPATLAAAVLTAVSPAMVFFSRDYIQEILLVAFAALALGALWRHCRSPRAAWAVLLGLALGLMFATKETSVLFIAALAAARGAVALRHRTERRRARPSPRESPATTPAHPSDSSDSSDSSDPSDPAIPPATLLRHFLLTAATAAAVAALFYSSFLTNLRGPLDSLLAYGHYLDRTGGEGSTALHRHPWHYYLKLLAFTKDAPGPWWSEGLILGLAAVGLFVAARGRRAGTRVPPDLALLLAIYTLCLTAAFSLIPYKTPWNMLGFLHGLILLAGIGLDWLLGRLPWRSARAALVLLVLAGAAQLAGQAARASFRFGADPRNPYAYAHSSPDVVRLAQRITAIAALHPNGASMPVHFISPDYWPMPYYLRTLQRVGYWHAIPPNPEAPVIVASPDLQAQLEPQLGDRYAAEFYGLRPGVLVVCNIRQDLWQRFLDRLHAPAERSAPPVR